MMSRTVSDEVMPLAASVVQRVRLSATHARVAELCITRPGVIAYLRTIEPDKLELALLHVLDVGVAELARRRPR